MIHFQSVKWDPRHALNNGTLPGICSEDYESTTAVVKLQLFSVHSVSSGFFSSCIAAHQGSQTVAGSLQCIFPPGLQKNVVIMWWTLSNNVSERALVQRGLLDGGLSLKSEGGV